jgi:hypothetical protein
MMMVVTPDEDSHHANKKTAKYEYSRCKKTDALEHSKTA